MRVWTPEQWPDLVMVGRIISKVKRVPVGRKLTSMEVLESVFCTPFAMARRFPRPSVGVVCGGGGVALYTLISIPSLCSILAMNMIEEFWEGRPINDKCGSGWHGQLIGYAYHVLGGYILRLLFYVPYHQLIRVSLILTQYDRGLCYCITHVLTLFIHITRLVLPL